MLSVVTLSSSAPEGVRDAPEVISHATDVDTVRAHLAADVMISSSADYREQVFEWFDHARDTFGMIVNANGTVDVWVFDACELAA